MNTGKVHFDSWAEHTSVPVAVLGKTKHRTRVRVLADEPLRGWKTGDVVCVPHYAVTLDALQLALDLDRGTA